MSQCIIYLLFVVFLIGSGGNISTHLRIFSRHLVTQMSFTKFAHHKYNDSNEKYEGATNNGESFDSFLIIEKVLNGRCTWRWGVILGGICGVLRDVRATIFVVCLRSSVGTAFWGTLVRQKSVT